MKFLADEGLDAPIVTALRQAGLDVEYVLEKGQGTSDEQVLTRATKEHRILITQDMD